MKAEVLKGLMMMREGLDMIINSADEGVNEAPTTAKPVPTKAEKNVEEKEVEAPTVVKGHLSREQLDSMTYNDLKKLAKEIGVSAVGARPELTDRILGVEVEAEEVDVDVSDAPEEEPTGDGVADKVRALVADMSVSDIADVLAEVGVSAKGKKEALVEKLIKAVKDGLISLEDDDEEASEEEAETTDEPNVAEEEAVTEEAEATDEDEEYDPTNDPENPNMTKARKTALVAFDKSTRASVENGEISYADMRTFLAEFHDMEVSDLDEYTDEEILDFYVDAASRFIDDDGEIVEEEAYMLNGEPACCGHALEYEEDKNSFHCAVCGNDYAADDE